MKQFTTLKVGHSHEIYGCSAEYFTTIIVNGDKMVGISHYGMCGSEERINRTLKDLGYFEKYIPSDFGSIKSRQAWKGFLSEKEAISEIEKM